MHTNPNTLRRIFTSLFLALVLVFSSNVPLAKAEGTLNHNIYIGRQAASQTVYSDFIVYTCGGRSYHKVRLRIWARSVTSTSMFVEQVGVRIEAVNTVVYSSGFGVYGGSTRWYGPLKPYGEEIMPHHNIAHNYIVNKMYRYPSYAAGIVFWKDTSAANLIGSGIGRTCPNTKINLGIHVV